MPDRGLVKTPEDPVEVSRTLATADGVVIGYRLWRPGSPRRVLVLLHGVASNLSRWSELVRATSLRDSWDLLRLDLRGYATSNHRGRLDLDVWCADLAAVLEREACPPAVVAGHCLGACVAVELARRRPDRVSGLILVDPIVREALVGPLRRVALLRPLLVPLVGMLRGLNALGLRRRHLPPLDLERLDQETRAAMAADGAGELTRRYASPWEDLRTTSTATYLQSLMAVSRGIPDLSGVRVPVLALIAADGVLSDRVITERVLAGFPHCRVRRVDARHWIPTERPVELREAVEAWCGELARGGRP
jgi:pimeloyl-ACP methyl ester carboxylesterase